MDESSSGNDDSQSLQSFLAARQSQLRERLHYFLRELHPVLQADVRRALEGPGKLLSQSPIEDDMVRFGLPAGYWSLLTLLVAQTISPKSNILTATSVAVAIECFMCALDLLDDVEDEDQTETIQAMGTARALNISTALLMLAQRAILSLLRHRLKVTMITKLLNVLQEAALVATTGQHYDLLTEKKPVEDCSYEQCIEIAEKKAGALVAVACHLGALCAGADEEACKKFVELGRLLGIASQLDNDSHDLYYLLHSENTSAMASSQKSGGKAVKSDLVRRKKTLPIVLAAKVENTTQEMMQLDDAGKMEAHLQALHEGILTTWGICLLYRERAHHCLQKIDAQYPISPALRLLLGFK